ncbi:MAG: M20/M25/M40 family metallo-hydrolase [Saprospiraceae bacterium]|nr:M20/M25/M40 family metallo-hydrolase [Pyrinomonadaceae bacterium]
MLRRKILGASLIYAFLLPSVAFAQTANVGTASAPAAKVYSAPKEVIDKIRDEGMNRSQVMQTLSYLTDVIGGRLTNSPNMKAANIWTRDTMAKWGMQNAKLEAWGPFGRGWSLKSFSAQVVEPQTIPVIGYPKAWSTSTRGPVTSEVVLFNPKDATELDKFRGKLKNKIIFVSNLREVKAEFGGLATRTTDEELAKIVEPETPRDRPQQTEEDRKKQRDAMAFNLFVRPNFLLSEGAAVIVDSSRSGPDEQGGNGGTIFVQQASAVSEMPKDMENFSFRSLAPVYDKRNESRIIPQITIATEDYNRILRMINLGVTPKMTIDIQTQYHDEDLMGYNTVAEIPGTDPLLKDEVVMLGGHMDSWHSSTGATDNAAGTSVAMEAARILIASGLKPRRTIRVALWSGEEQGLNGSREYVKQQFGEMKPAATPGQPGQLIKGANYDKLSAYYNLDNGTGKIRGVYMQGNSAVRPYFEAWLAPFGDLGAKTLTMRNTGGTDHLSFDRIGLPGFQFIQDEIEYSTRTHHTNQDNYDRIQAEDMKQASTIMAAFVYQTAMMDEKMPRKTAR